jgi:DNA repair exonuclease SbcCD ATPase subunit
VDFNIKRNKTEAELYFMKNGEKYDPLNSSGYGAVDIASFALRIAAWSLSSQKHSNIFILDEPFKHLSEDLQEKGMQMLHELSEKLKLQFILITHTKESDVLEYSDKVFRVRKTGDYSVIKILKGK